VVNYFEFLPQPAEMRRCGAHQVILPDGSILQQAVVEIQEGRVVNYFEFREELPMTEWLGGEIRVERDEEGILRALWNGKVINKH
jgi:hypothetical protein